MSYTAPEYVDTRAQAILVLASTIADEDKTGIGNCSVRAALDVLADTLADSDVTIPETDAGEILALAQYVSGGGGGGGDFTTATVTIVNDTGGSSVMILGAHADLDEDMAIGAKYIEEESVVMTAILFKGKSYIVESTGGFSVAATGDAEVDEYGNVIVSGDCTITYSQE